MTRPANDYPGYSNILFQRERAFAFISLRSDLDSMERFTHSMSTLLSAESTKLKAQLGKTPWEEGSRREVEVRELREMDGGFRDLLISWMLVAFYGRFESFLVELCRRVYTTGVSRHDPVEAKVEHLNQVRTYLKLLPNFTFPEQDSAWTKILALGQLRNTIAHSNRILRGNPKRRRTISGIPGVSVVDRYKDQAEVWVQADVLPHALEVLRRFTDLLEQAFGPTGKVPSAS